MTTKDRWDAKLYDHSHSFVNQMATGLIDLLSPQPGERILDLGCGTGPLTQKIADCGAVVIGIDASPAMVEMARPHHPAISFQVLDALAMRFDQEFDAIFSNAVLHWIKPPQAAAERMFAALKTGGRLVLEMGGNRNVYQILHAAVSAGDWLGINLRPAVDINYFPSVGEYASVLEQAGFEVATAALFDRPTPLNDAGAGLRNWIRMFRPDVEETLPRALVEPFFEKVEQICRPRMFINGTWTADYRRLRVTAIRR